MAEKAQQHSIPQCYLKSWCDPRTPEGYTPYIWHLSKDDGSFIEKRAPVNSFTELYKYTLTLPSGEKSNVIEDTLQKIENKFPGILNKIQQRKELTWEDETWLNMFTAAMYLRTGKIDANTKLFYESLQGKAAFLKQKNRIEPKLSIELERKIAESSGNLLANTLLTISKILIQIPFKILVNTTDELGFIATDNPYFSMHKGFPDGILPLSPQHLLVFPCDPESSLYQNIDQEQLDNANRILRYHAKKEFISWKGETRPAWFATPKF